jgi:A/G-specific adenine glycosylase
MAQQTQVARVGAAWRVFMVRFPTAASLAAASPADAIRAWSGLGYNRRAINLRRAAVAIVDRHAGRVPDALAALEALPGVGPYTARAVGAIAFGQPVAAVDVNVRRVIGRIVSGSAAPSPRCALQGIADGLVPRARPADWTHALMDLGATLCRQRSPVCAACPAVAWCRFASEPHAPEADGTRRSGRAVRERQPGFESTTRWLRGRLIDSLRMRPAGEWQRFAAPIGPHSSDAVAAALDRLAADGLVETDPADGRRARLPLA